MMQADSKGRYLNTNIKGRYEYAKQKGYSAIWILSATRSRCPRR